VTSSDVLDGLDEHIRARSILEHPFYQAWEGGALGRDQLATYARVYYPHVGAFPLYLQLLIARTPDPATREALGHNLADELSEPTSHADLWLDFAEAVGLDRAAVAAAPSTPAASEVTATFLSLTGRDPASGLAALYAYESQQPEVSRRKIAGLRDHYGVRDPRGLAYFEVHATADLDHRCEERKALERCLCAGADPAAIGRAADEALDAYWRLLDGVCAEAGILAAVPSTGVGS
jgi:pyrroloquinoline-quinone synthase